jgi:hypothetical protein
VKTRLAAAIGAEQALGFYVETLAAVTGRLSPGPWDLRIAITPDESDGVLFGTPTIPQGEGDLGARMLRQLQAAGPDAPVLILGSDVPELEASHVSAAVERLEAHDLVLGPSPDGGYWLVGARRPPPDRLFDNVRWSSPHALADTLRNARGLQAALVQELEDVDDEESYRRFLARRG